MRFYLIALGWLLVGLVHADDRPKLVMDKGLRIVIPHDLLAIPEIRTQLESGLTTTILFQYRLSVGTLSGTSKNSIHIQIRFEPWEEVFFLEWIDAQQVHHKQTVAGWQGLRAWWISQHWLVWQKGSVQPSGQAALRLSFELIPFSQADRDRALRLFVSQGQPSDDGNAPVGDVPGRFRSNSPSPVMNLIIQTASKRKPIIRFQWTLTHTFGSQNLP